MVADIIDAITREVIILLEIGNRAAGLASAVSFAVFSALCIGTGLVIECIQVYKHRPYTWKKPQIVHTVVQAIGAFLYYYGENINELLETYGEALGCSEQCLLNNRIAATITLGGAFISLQFLPQVLSIAIPEEDHGKTIQYRALNMIVTIIKIDLLYTAIAIMTQTDVFCGHIDQSLSISFTVICVLLGLLLLTTKCYQLIKFINRLDKHCWRHKRVTKKGVQIILGTSTACLILGFALFILADNSQPLDCAFNCDFTTTNETLNNFGCDENGVAVAKLVLAVTASVFIFPSVLLLIYLDIYTPTDPLPVKSLLEKLHSKIWPERNENFLEVHLLRTLDTREAAALLVSLPAEYAAKVLVGDGDQVPTLPAYLVAAVLAEIPANRAAEILAEKAVPTDRMAGILAEAAMPGSQVEDILKQDVMAGKKAEIVPLLRGKLSIQQLRRLTGQPTETHTAQSTV